MKAVKKKDSNYPESLKVLYNQYLTREKVPPSELALAKFLRELRELMKVHTPSKLAG